MARSEDRRLRPETAVVLVVPSIYLLVLSWNAPALGVRYVLPVLPFLILGGAVLVGRTLPGHTAPIAAAMLALLQIASAAHALAHSPLSWFNGLDCSTGQVPPCLDDSNVDWGHALPALGEYANEAALSEVRLLYFGGGRPEVYDPRLLRVHPSELREPRPAVYAVSLHLVARTPALSWIHQRAPDTVVAGAYAIYDLRPGG